MKPNHVHVNLVLPCDIWREFRSLAFRNGHTASALISEMIREHLRIEAEESIDEGRKACRA